jgi:uncharacterized membrane protein
MGTPRWLAREGFGPAEEARVVAAIREAESRTSGEIRVHVERRCPGDPLEVARLRFASLGMNRTKQRNGVLLFLALADRKLAMVGDEGIHSHVGAAFWRGVLDRLLERLRAQEMGAGIEEAVLAVGAKLAERFPAVPGDVNELLDSISSDEGAAPGSP